MACADVPCMTSRDWCSTSVTLLQTRRLMGESVESVNSYLSFASTHYRNAQTYVKNAVRQYPWAFYSIIGPFHLGKSVCSFILTDKRGVLSDTTVLILPFAPPDL